MPTRARVIAKRYISCVPFTTSQNERSSLYHSEIPSQSQTINVNSTIKKKIGYFRPNMVDFPSQETKFIIIFNEYPVEPDAISSSRDLAGNIENLQLTISSRLFLSTTSCCCCCCCYREVRAALSRDLLPCKRVSPRN